MNETDYRGGSHPSDGLSALVLGGAPIVRAGIAYMVRREFGTLARIVTADWQVREQVLAASGAQLDILVVHPDADATPQACSSVVSGVNGGIVVILPPAGSPVRSPMVRAGMVAIRLEAPLQAWRRALQVAAKRRLQFGPRLGAAISTTAPSAPLTERQLEVLELLSQGLPNKTIANRLNLSVGTVKLHVGAVLHALNARSRMDILLRRATAQPAPRANDDRVE